MTDGTDVEQQPAAGDEGGQAPIPAPEPRSAAGPAGRPRGRPARAARALVRPHLGRPRSAADGDAVYVTPLVRKLAKEHDVDLATVKGTGVGGRIRKQDVLAAAEEAKAAAEAAKAAPAPAPAAAAAAPAPAAAKAAPSVEPSTLRGTTEKMSRLRKTIAKRMVESQQVSATLTATVEVDLTRHLADPRQGQGRLQAPRGREPVLPAVHHQGDGRGAEGLPEAQRDDRHRGRARSPTRAPSTSASRSTPRRACSSR